MNSLRKIRIKQKMTQQELAKKLGIERATVTKWELGYTSPRIAKLPELARVLHCTVDDLLKEDA